MGDDADWQDFELAFWQLTYLIVSPRRVYKQTYHQYVPFFFLPTCHASCILLIWPSGLDLSTASRENYRADWIVNKLKMFGLGMSKFPFLIARGVKADDSPAMLILISGFSARKSFPTSLLFELPPEMRLGKVTDLVVSGLIWSLIYHKSILSTITQMVLMIFRTYPSIHPSLFILITIAPKRRTRNHNKRTNEEKS